MTTDAAPNPVVEAPRSDVMTRRRGRGRRTGSSAWAYLILVPGCLLFLAPLAWLVSASFQPIGEIFSYPPKWIPENPTLDGYKKFLGIGDFAVEGASGAWRWFLNSAIVAIAVTTLQLFFNSLAAYVFAKRDFPGRNAIFVLFLATMMIPGQVTLIPNYLVLKHMPLFGGNDILGQGGSGWLDSYYGLILPSAVSAFGIFLLRQYMLSIPDELLDAARIDGASEFKIYARIVMPLCGPALAANGDLHLHGLLGGLLLAADHRQQSGALHRAARAGTLRGGEPDPVGHADGRLGAGHHPDGAGVHLLPAPLRPGHLAERHEGLMSRS